MVLQLLAAMVGTIAFSHLYSVPKSYYVYCGLIGAIGWGVYLGIGNHFGSGAAVLVATMVIMFLSRLMAVIKGCPATIFLVAGIFPLVPGAGLYWTTYYIVTKQFFSAMQTGYTAIETAFAIVLGIVFVFELPQALFSRLGSLLKPVDTYDRIDN